MGVTSIQWCDFTFNPWIGCQRVSPGCQRCYAEAYDKRVGGVPVSQRPSVDSPAILRWGPNAPRTRTSASYWRQPLKWDGEAKAAGVRKRVFCSSLADVFEDRAELIGWREDLFGLIASTRNLDWLLLTKRPENVTRLWPEFVLEPGGGGVLMSLPPGPKTWPNVWLGTTVEDQQRADERIPHLLAVAAAVRFLSVEPMLEPIRLPSFCACGCGLTRKAAVREAMNGPAALNAEQADAIISTTLGVDWVIVGGESGAGARTFDINWALDLQRQCAAAGTAFFMKQLGAKAVVGDAAHESERGEWRTKNRKGDDIAEFPQGLQVRQFPEARP